MKIISLKLYHHCICVNSNESFPFIIILGMMLLRIYVIFYCEAGRCLSIRPSNRPQYMPVVEMLSICSWMKRTNGQTDNQIYCPLLFLLQQINGLNSPQGMNVTQISGFPVWFHTFSTVYSKSMRSIVSLLKNFYETNMYSEMKRRYKTRRSMVKEKERENRNYKVIEEAQNMKGRVSEMNVRQVLMNHFFLFFRESNFMKFELNFMNLYNDNYYTETLSICLTTCAIIQFYCCSRHATSTPWFKLWSVRCNHNDPIGWETTNTKQLNSSSN